MARKKKKQPNVNDPDITICTAIVLANKWQEKWKIWIILIGISPLTKWGWFLKKDVHISFFYHQFIPENIKNVYSKVATTMWNRWRNETRCHRQKGPNKGWNLTLNSAARLSQSLTLLLAADERRMWFGGFGAFLRFQIKHKQCLPAVMCAALLCMVFAKKSVIMEVIPQESQTRAPRFSPPATTPKHIFKMCNTLVLSDKVH